jgi:hypothetical protein
MPIDTPARRLSWTELDQRHQEALIEAEALRHQAIDDFWRGADAALATAATQALRAGTRLAARLHRRRAATAGG